MIETSAVSSSLYTVILFVNGVQFLIMAKRLQRGQLSAQEIELKKLEQLEPGITKVNWSEDGALILDQEISPEK